MTCKKCRSGELKLEAQFISFDNDTQRELLNEVYECTNCGDIQTVKAIG